MRLRPIGLLVTLAFGLLGTPLPAEAQPPGKVYRIGFLASAPAAALAQPRSQAFLQGLRDLGYAEGRNITIEWRWAAGKPDRLPNLAAELVRLKADVIVAEGTPETLAVKKLTTTIPIVFTVAADPVGSGLVASLGRPGGNVTGLSIISPELTGKRLELLKEALPEVVRVAVLLNPANPVSIAQLKETEAAARTLGLHLRILETRDPGQFEGAFATMTRERAGALIVLTDSMLSNYRARLVDLATKHRLPSMMAWGEAVEAGGFMAYGPNFPDLFRRAAILVDKILKGARPADLPVEQPTKFALIVNLKTAKALGLTIPPSVLIRADEIIQ